MSWFPCPGCDKIVTGLVRGTGPRNTDHYSRTHCSLQCERGEGNDSSDTWGCAGIPGAVFRETVLEDDIKAHYIAHVPEGEAALPAVLFLHGGMTYKYPESLWYADVAKLIDKNPVVKERFIVIAPLATIGEPLAVVSNTRTTTDRFGNNIPYIDEFDTDMVWETFMQACKALNERVDWSRLSVVGFSMGGQATWSLMMSNGSQLAAAVPFSGSCSWANFDWNEEENVLKQLEHLSIRSYNGMSDSRTYSLQDFTWLAEKRGLESKPDPREEEYSGNVVVKVHEWDKGLQLFLLTGASDSHNCWETVWHNENSFNLFTWLELRRSISGGVNIAPRRTPPPSRCRFPVRAVMDALSATLANSDSQDGAPREGANDTSVHWYFQEPTTRQPAGPWTLEQLITRWRRNAFDGCTLVWRTGFGAWQPISDVTELKDALRNSTGVDEEKDAEDMGDGGPAAKRRRQMRVPIDDVPLTHTYTSEQGLLYIYDTIDDDWKLIDAYEALLAEEAELLPASTTKTIEGAVHAAETSETAEPAEPPDMESENQEAAMKEFLAETQGIGETMLVGAGAAAGSKKSKLIQTPSGTPAVQKPVPEEGTPVDDETEAKRQKRRDYRERKKLKKQAGLFVKAQDNPNVYVSGLPADITLQELETAFKRAGVLKLDVDTGDAKIRIYGDDERGCKGDALVTYANAGSVELAVKFLHEFEIRPKCYICVQQADFEDVQEKAPKMSKDELKALAASRKGDPARAKYLAAKNAMKEAVSWSGEMDDGTGRKIVVLRHMFSPDEAAAEGTTDAEFYAELAEEVREECEKIGQVSKVTPIERHKQGVVCVKFRSSAEAEECIRVMDGRFFGGRTVEASFYDGRTDFRAFGIVQSTEQPGSSTATQQSSEASIATEATPSSATATDAVPSEAANTDAPQEGAKSIPENLPKEQKQQQSWEEWLNNQSSDSEDEEFQLRCEE